MTKEQKINEVYTLVKKCKNCSLYKTRNNPVIGEGSIDTAVMFIGEAPGRNEDIQGRPFVGKAGKILDQLLNSIDLERKDVYIANILKCRPPNNRNPLKKEIKNCVNFLDQQIKIIKPKIIAPLGNFAVTYIFEKYGMKPDKIGNAHGKIFCVKNGANRLTIIPLYHPAAAVYNPNLIDFLISDFKSISKALND